MLRGPRSRGQRGCRSRTCHDLTVTAEEDLGTVGIARRVVDAVESRRASRRWWDADADDYLAEHGADIGEVDFVWCPEGLREQDARLLGEVAGRRVLEVGAGSAPCARWLLRAGARPVALDLSAGMLGHAAALARSTGLAVPLVQADATQLPFRDGAFDVACSAFGAVPFVAEPEQVMREVARVLRPGGRWVFAVNHPMRWMFSDDPGPDGLVVRQSYFDRMPYVEVDGHGAATYVEHHRTLGDRVRDIVAAGPVLGGLVEPGGPGGKGTGWGPWWRLPGGAVPRRRPVPPPSPAGSCCVSGVTAPRSQQDRSAEDSAQRAVHLNDHPPSVAAWPLRIEVATSPARLHPHRLPGRRRQARVPAKAGEVDLVHGVRAPPRVVRRSQPGDLQPHVAGCAGRGRGRRAAGRR